MDLQFFDTGGSGEEAKTMLELLAQDSSKVTVSS